MHFEELWEKCENLQKEINSNDSSQEIINELILKINLYKAIDAKIEMSEEDRTKIKSRTLGEILLTLTGLSFKDNINVYEVLNIALQYRSIAYYNSKY